MIVREPICLANSESFSKWWCLITNAAAYGNLRKRSVRMVQYVDSAGIIYGTLRAVDKTLYVQTPHQSCIQHEIFKLINPKTVPVKLFRLEPTLRRVWVKFITLTCEKCNEVALLYAKLIWRESLRSTHNALKWL